MKKNGEVMMELPKISIIKNESPNFKVLQIYNDRKGVLNDQYLLNNLKIKFIPKTELFLQTFEICSGDENEDLNLIN